MTKEEKCTNKYGKCYLAGNNYFAFCNSNTIKATAFTSEEKQNWEAHQCSVCNEGHLTNESISRLLQEERIKAYEDEYKKGIIENHITLDEKMVNDLRNASGKSIEIVKGIKKQARQEFLESLIEEIEKKINSLPLDFATDAEYSDKEMTEIMSGVIKKQYETMADILQLLKQKKEEL